MQMTRFFADVKMVWTCIMK